MTNAGTVKGITRMGIISQKSSILARASFETPVKQFVNASLKDNKDELNSLAEKVFKELRLGKQASSYKLVQKSLKRLTELILFSSK